MGVYKISDLAKLSGVKPHTIRAWESRYDILTPLRTDTNIRYYDDLQLRKLLNVVSLMNSGSKISVIGNLSDRDVISQINALLISGSSEQKEEIIINQLIGSGLSYDENSFEKAFSRSILSFGLIETYQKVLYPMLVKIGYLWTMSELTVSQEHFITSLVKQKILTAIDSLPLPKKSNERWLLFLPVGEVHDLGLLIAHYAIRKNGGEVIYLGRDLGKENLVEVISVANPSKLLSFVVRYNQSDLINDYLFTVNEKYSDLQFVVCCDKTYNKKIHLYQGQEIVSSFDDFLEMILKDL